MSSAVLRRASSVFVVVAALFRRPWTIIMLAQLPIAMVCGGSEKMPVCMQCNAKARIQHRRRRGDLPRFPRWTRFTVRIDECAVGGVMAKIKILQA